MHYRTIAVLALLAPLAGCMALGNSAGGLTGEQEIAAHQALERARIEELLWRYARTLDSADADGYAAVYTEDGEFTSGNQSIKGRAALHKFVADLKKSREDRKAKGENPGGTLHMTANHRIDFTSTSTATVHSYWITMFPASGRENPARVGGVGRAEDKLVKIDGKWLIKVRNVGLTD
jgi:uncharacterized protein (TIGR02246 family)